MKTPPTTKAATPKGKTTTIKTAPPAQLVADVKTILQSARQTAYSAINHAMNQAYWQIGRRIVEEEQAGKSRADYGKNLITHLSKELTHEFGRGFSYANLANFRQFYLKFPDEQILYTLCRELSWSHLRLIMRVDNPKALEYYRTEARIQQWSVRQLERNINTLYYERLLSSSAAKEVNVAEENQAALHIKDVIKDPYILEFLQLPEHAPKERDLETAIINNLSQFLLEAGKGFSFIGRQVRISTETHHFYIDLVFYHYVLKCFVLIDLKTDQLTHQDIGQMDTYVRMFDEFKRGPDDNPTVGLILCSQKDETLVKFSVLADNAQLFASKYRLILPSEAELIAEIERERRLIEMGGQ